MTSKKALGIIGDINLGNNPYVNFDEDKLKNRLDEEYNIIKQDLDRLKELEKENQELKSKYNVLFNTFSKQIEEKEKLLDSRVKYIEENTKLKKIIKNYCYIDNFDNGEIVRMCCESYEESNNNDFVFLKEVLSNGN